MVEVICGTGSSTPWESSWLCGILLHIYFRLECHFYSKGSCDRLCFKPTKASLVIIWSWGVVVFALNIFHHYLYTIQYTIYMDHNSFRYFVDQPNPNMRHHGWLNVLKDYNCKILYQQGKGNVVVNTLSHKTTGTPIQDLCLRMTITSSLKDMIIDAQIDGFKMGIWKKELSGVWLIDSSPTIGAIDPMCTSLDSIFQGGMSDWFWWDLGLLHSFSWVSIQHHLSYEHWHASLQASLWDEVSDLGFLGGCWAESHGEHEGGSQDN